MKRTVKKRWPEAMFCPPTKVALFATLSHEALYAEAADESGKQQTKPAVADGCELLHLLILV